MPSRAPRLLWGVFFSSVDLRRVVPSRARAVMMGVMTTRRAGARTKVRARRTLVPPPFLSDDAAFFFLLFLFSSQSHPNTPKVAAPPILARNPV